MTEIGLIATGYISEAVVFGKVFRLALTNIFEESLSHCTTRFVNLSSVYPV